MSQAFISCPKTGKAVYVGLNMEWPQLESLDLAAIDRRVPECPHCGETHRFGRNDLFLRTDGAG